jgi:hypothetical protein
MLIFTIQFLSSTVIMIIITFLVVVRVFKHSAEEVDVKGDNSVDAEWMAYLGGFRHLRYLNIAECHRINSSALWPITGST